MQNASGTVTLNGNPERKAATSEIRQSANIERHHWLAGAMAGCHVLRKIRFCRWSKSELARSAEGWNCPVKVAEAIVAWGSGALMVSMLKKSPASGSLWLSMAWLH